MRIVVEVKEHGNITEVTVKPETRPTNDVEEIVQLYVNAAVNFAVAFMSSNNYTHIKQELHLDDN